MKKAIQFGAGNIGRGFIGALLSKSNYFVTFVDVNQELLEAINNQKKYKIFVKDVECFEETIQNIEALHSNDKDLPKKILDASIITTALGPLVLPKIAPVIAEGIKLRKQNNILTFLNIIACENMVCATDFLKQEIIKYLDSEEIEYLNKYIGFPNSSVDRIVPPVKTDNIIDVTVEKFYEWNVEKDNIKGQNLDIEGMNLVSNLQSYVERKLFTLNTGHSITAYLGFLKGYKTIDQSIQDEKIFNIVKNAMQESGRGLSKKHNLNLEEHFKYIDKILSRFKNKYLEDDVVRVGREPLRKLSETDRLVKPLLTAKKYGFDVENLIIGIAAALNYKAENDQQSIDMNNIIISLNFKDAVKKITNISDLNLINDIEDKFVNIKSFI